MTDEPIVAGREALRIHLASFDGPLDLLLHLVRVNEVDLTNIPILEIAAQYDAFLEMMRELDLEIAGDYLVMAATLVHIKSRLLLPPDP
jgi:segregation and condensation protein A